MEKMQFKITIDSPREKVWNVLWEDASYRDWTSAFSEGSNVVTDWKEGSKVLFLDGNGRGMVSRIAAKKLNEFMSFEHLGEVNNGVEDLDSDRVKQWAGAHENYTLKSVDGKTELTMDMDIDKQFYEMFVSIWPKAMQRIKELSEVNAN